MPYRTFQRLVAVFSMLIVLTGASLHLLCGVHEAHALEWQSGMSPAHEHIVCDCQLCPCSEREATLAVQWKTIDGTSFQPGVMTTDWRYDAPSTGSTCLKQSFVPPDTAPSSHLRSQKVTVILI